ncbi:MAG: hypothetical protein ACFE85_15765 [Candidatus Hodarchaeota archaeon]
MANRKKIELEVLVYETEGNICAKCCKTKNVIDRMMDTFPIINESVDVIYNDVNSKEIIEKYGKLEGPSVLINQKIFSDGNVPIIKKLSQSLLALCKESNH